MVIWNPDYSLRLLSLCYLAPWIARCHRYDETHTKSKRRSRLKSDNTMSSFSMKWRRGGDSALDFSFAGTLLPRQGADCLSEHPRSKHFPKP